ncbi:hypothetical protein NPIL_373861 [Nephila pilipes]|uniref:Uncharacterized protein n=1 Tax=Nephila pilipes TaxID=299642 RepID=A0A8X6NZY0_NEPPI|nr:hypothetical protein NPIL_373861 [Nephila pilipes]
MEEAKEPTLKTDILQAIHFVLSARHEITTSAIQNSFVKCSYVRKNHEECPTKGQENNDNDNADEEWLRVAEDVSGGKFSDYISIDQAIATCCILSIEEMCVMRKIKKMAKKQRSMRLGLL